MTNKIIKIADLKPGQKVSINGMSAEYLGIQKIKIPNFGKVEKRVFKVEGTNTYHYYSFTDGSKTLESQKMKLM